MGKICGKNLPWNLKYKHLDTSQPFGLYHRIPFLFNLLLALCCGQSFAQTLEWEPLELGHEEIAKRNIKWMAFSTDRQREDGTGEYFEYDKNGYVSLVADTHDIGGTYHRYETKVDEKGRLKEEIIQKEKVLKKGLETFGYNEYGLLVRHHKLHVGYGIVEIITLYHYKDQVLLKKESTIDGKPFMSEEYFNNGQGLADSSLEYSMRRRDAELIYKTYYKWFKNGQKAGEWKLAITGDTMEIHIYDKDGHLLYEKRPILEYQNQNDELLFESKQYVYKKGKLREEIWKNDTYAADDGGRWEYRIHYNKRGIRLDNHGDLMITETSKSRQGEWLIEYTLFKGDTVEMVKTRKTANGKEEHIQKMGTAKHMDIIPTQVNIYNKQGKLTKTWLEERHLEEKCTTTYVNTTNQVYETIVCARTGYDKGAESIERTTYFKNEDGHTKRKTLETKNYEADDTLKLFEETLFWYTKDGKMDSAVYQRHWEGDTMGNTYKYLYNSNGQVERVLYYNQKGNTALVVKTDSFFYSKTGELRSKTVASTNGINRGSLPRETRFYDENGKLTRVLYGKEKSEDRTEVIITYNQAGLCTKQAIFTDGSWSKETLIIWGFDQ